MYFLEIYGSLKVYDYSVTGNVNIFRKAHVVKRLMVKDTKWLWFFLHGRRQLGQYLSRITMFLFLMSEAMSLGM